MSPFFSVIIATRNRPELFQNALESVLSQNFNDYEILVINDGSSDTYISKYNEIESFYANKPITFVYQKPRPNGHGHSYSINTGAHIAKGKYLCFLDDDDRWTDDDHLQRAYVSINKSELKIQLYYTNQVALLQNGKKNDAKLWLEDLSSKVSNFKLNSQDTYFVDSNFLLTSDGFAHLNCTIIEKLFFNSIQGMDEGIRYENDRDFYLRSIDNADNILYSKSIIGVHNIPDPLKTNNLSTSINILSKFIFQITVFEKTALLCKSSNVRKYSLRAMSDIYKKIAVKLLDINETSYASVYAWKALSCRFTLKWFCYCFFLSLLNMVNFIHRKS